MKSKNRYLMVGVVVAGLLAPLGTWSSGVLATSNPPDTTPGGPPDSAHGGPPESTPGNGSQPESTIVVVGTDGPDTGYPPGFDVVVERINTSGAPDAVKQRIIQRIEVLKNKAVASPPSLGALGALLGQTISDSPLRDQIREQLRLRLREFDRLMQSDDLDQARDEVRQIISRYRKETLQLVQERVHTRLDGLIARLPELPESIDTEAWRETFVRLRNDVLGASDLAEMRDVVVEVRAALGDLRRDIKES
jgi:hypothetical protein